MEQATPIEKTIKEIEEGVVSEFIETLSDNDEIMPFCSVC
jgi:hypothetical protein